MDEKQWNEYKQRSRTWATRIDFDLLHSAAYKELNYAPALKLLTWFHEKVKVKVNKKKKGNARYQVLDGDLSFTYSEGECRGLSHEQFSRAIREIHKLGFIDIKKPGSRLRNDWTSYLISNRWRDFGTPEFKEIAWQTSIKWRNYGYGSKEKKLGKRPGKRNLLSGNSPTIQGSK